MNARRDSEIWIGCLSDEDVYREALRAAQSGDRETAGELYLVMADRKMPWARQRDVVEAIYPTLGHSRGFLTPAEQRRAFRRFERRPR